VDELRVIVKKVLQKVKQKMIPQTFLGQDYQLRLPLRKFAACLQHGCKQALLIRRKFHVSSME